MQISRVPTPPLFIVYLCTKDTNSTAGQPGGALTSASGRLVKSRPFVGPPGADWDLGRGVRGDERMAREVVSGCVRR